MENRNRVSIEATVYLPNPQRGNLLAFASVTIAGCFAVNGVKVMQGKNGLFVSMPQMQDCKDEWHDVCFPVTSETRQAINRVVLGEYQRARLNAEQSGIQNRRPEARSENAR